MLGSANVVAFAPTRDPGKAREFYEKTLGLTVISDDDYALAVDANGTMLRIQKVGDFMPHPFTALGWQVPDISSVVQTRDGALVLQVVTRQPVDEARLKAELPAFIERLREQRQREASNEWVRKEFSLAHITGPLSSKKENPN